MSDTRFLRFAVWALLTLSAFLVVEIVDPYRALFVPCVFLPLMIPMVLMPFRRSQA